MHRDGESVFLLTDDCAFCTFHRRYAFATTELVTVLSSLALLRPSTSLSTDGSLVPACGIAQAAQSKQTKLPSEGGMFVQDVHFHTQTLASRRHLGGVLGHCKCQVPYVPLRRGWSESASAMELYDCTIS